MTKIIENVSLKDLEKELNTYLRKGYSVQGGISFNYETKSYCVLLVQPF